jgi:hypothetical protein
MATPRKQKPAKKAVSKGVVVAKERCESIEKAKHPGGRPPIFATAEEMQLKIEEYFDSCWVDKVSEATDKDGKCTMSTVHYQNRPYTIMGLALHLGMGRETLCQYSKDGEFSDIVKRAKQKVEMAVEELLLEKGHSGSIFWLKNHAGYTDKIIQEQTGADGGPIEIAHQYSISDDALLAIAIKGKNG